MGNYNFNFDILGENLAEKIGKFHKFLQERETNKKKKISINEYVDTEVFNKNDKEAAIKELAEFLLNEYQKDPSLESSNPLIKLLIDDYIQEKRNVFFTARKMTQSLYMSVFLEESVSLLESDKIKKLISTNNDLQTIYENVQKLDHMHKTDFIEGVKRKGNVK